MEAEREGVLGSNYSSAFIRDVFLQFQVAATMSDAMSACVVRWPRPFWTLAKFSHSIALQRLFRFLCIPNVRRFCLATGQLGLDHEKEAPSHQSSLSSLSLCHFGSTPRGFILHLCNEMMAVRTPPTKPPSLDELVAGIPSYRNSLFIQCCFRSEIVITLAQTAWRPSYDPLEYLTP